MIERIFGIAFGRPYFAAGAFLPLESDLAEQPFRALDYYEHESIFPRQKLRDGREGALVGSGLDDPMTDRAESRLAGQCERGEIFGVGGPIGARGGWDWSWRWRWCIGIDIVVLVEWTGGLAAIGVVNVNEDVPALWIGETGAAAVATPLSLIAADTSFSRSCH